jgi:replicative DNA helicase
MTTQPIDFEMPLPAANGACNEPEAWEEPIPFDAFEVPPFPIDALPPWAAQWCREEATAVQVPPDLPAMLSLATISLCIAKKVAVEVLPGWRVPTNLYTAVALAPGEGKSPVFIRATAAAREWEREQRSTWTPKIAAAKEERHLLEERQKDARKRALKPTPAGANAREEARELAIKLTEVQVPALPRLTADDATPEAVGRLLAEQGGRLGIFSSEGGPFAILAGRYSEGRANLELFCKAHSGDPYALDRVGRPSIHLDSPALTIALTVQPTVIAGLAATPEMRGQGLLARFLYAMPQSMVGRREAEPRPVKAGTVAAYDSRLEPRLLPGADLHLLADWVNKLPGTVARIACALHVAGHPSEWAAPIDSRTMHRAIAIGDYAIPHALAAFSVMGSDPSTELAKRAWAWLRTRPESTVTKRELHRALHVEHATDLDAPIAVLVERGYLREVPAKPTGGRPASPSYEINPLARR